MLLKPKSDDIFVYIWPQEASNNDERPSVLVAQMTVFKNIL